MFYFLAMDDDMLVVGEVGFLNNTKLMGLSICYWFSFPKMGLNECSFVVKIVQKQMPNG